MSAGYQPILRATSGSECNTALVPRLAEEIGENPVQGRSAAAFADGLVDAFTAIARALRPDGRMTVTFASRSDASWRALRHALRAARLDVVSEQHAPRSAPALTERTSPRATRTDAWLDCRPRR